jgi:type VI secretion system protein ImpB
MSSNESGQKFIGRNRAPRVQIEYEVELYGAEKTVVIPFVNGVLADLSGANRSRLPLLIERKFLDIDMDNFDERMQAINPQVHISVANKLTGEGEMAVSLSMKNMDDFSPGAIARNVEPLRKLLEARNQLANLLTFMDGKSGAEQLMAKLLEDPVLMKSLLEQSNQAADCSAEA